MANLNKVMLIGRLTRDPEVRTFSNGGKVAKFGFAVNNRRKNPDTGQWEEDPVFIDVDAFNRGEYGKLADLVAQYLSKGRQAYIEGHLRLNQWEKDGQKRSKLEVVADSIQFLDPRPGGEGEGGNSGYAQRTSSPHSEPVYANSDYGNSGGDYSPDAGGANGNDDDIPF
jgi:single-strand DNA-binding protein